MDPVSPVERARGVAPRTLWGELAWQLGGKAAFRKVQKNDELGTAPGTAILDEIVRGPALILVDEIAHYLRRASEVSLRHGSLAGQVPAFLQSLFELAAAKPRVAVVLTLASREDAFGAETGEVQERVGEMRAVLARIDHAMRPVEEKDLAPLLAKRIFSRVVTSSEVVDAFSQVSAKSQKRRSLEESYPFHPELLRVLRALPGLQGTRGLLRVLSLAARRIFQNKDNVCLIQPSHIDAVDELATRSSRREALTVDVAGHARELDREASAEDRPAVAERVARTIWLHADGCTREELALGVLEPGLDEIHIENATRDLLERAHYLHEEGPRLVFREEPSLAKALSEEKIGDSEALAVLSERLTRLYKGEPFELVVFPNSSEEIRDDARRPKLVVLREESDAARLSSVRNARGDFRKFPNNVVFLALTSLPDEARRVAALRRLATRIAIRRERLDESERALDEALVRSARALLHASEGGLSKHSIAATSARAVADELRRRGKLLDSGDALAPSFLEEKLGKDPCTVETFARRRDLPIVLDASILETRAPGKPLREEKGETPTQSEVLQGPPGTLEFQGRARRVTIESTAASDVRKLGLAVPRWPTVAIDVDVQWTANGNEPARIEYRGPWTRYRSLFKPAVDGLPAQEARVQLTLTPREPFTSEEIRRILADLDELRIEDISLRVERA